MPKIDIDYSNTIIYKITCKSPDVHEVYVGHTTNFVQRKYAHKQACTNTKTSNYNCKLYQVIRNNNGWDNWNMEIINFFNCKDSYEARQKEQEYFILFKATLNSMEPFPSQKPNNVTINVKECKEKKIYHCEHCNTTCSSEDTFNIHNETRKHKEIVSGKRASTTAMHNNNNSTDSFVCESCDFKCSKNVDWTRHVLTRKHINRTNLDNIEQKITPESIKYEFVCKKCNKEYKARTSLWYHSKKCNGSDPILLPINFDNKGVTDITDNDKKETDTTIGDSICSDNNITITKNMFMELINDNKEMMKIIKGQQDQINNIIPKFGNVTNNTNNTIHNNFNLNVFLNEHCKDALNISDFIDSLKITLDDLLFSKTNGISRGITDVLIKGLKELDIHKRPIHCTDIKRDIMYIKDEDKWQKDKNHAMIKNTIVKIADKERTALQQWAIDNPDWIETERKQIEYLTMMRSVCEPIENYNNYERKIIKNIGKEIIIDKNS
jgi:hypothetical protein